MSEPVIHEGMTLQCPSDSYAGDISNFDGFVNDNWIKDPFGSQVSKNVIFD